MDKTKIFIIVFALIISLILLSAVIFSIIDLTKESSPPQNGTPTPTQMVMKSQKHNLLYEDTHLDNDLNQNKTTIPQKVYIVYNEKGERFARTIKFNDPLLQSMNVLDLGGIVEPMKNDKSYGLAVLHADVNGENKLVIISNYNTSRSKYRNIDLIDNTNRKISRMHRLTNVNTILFGLANGIVYYFNPIQDHWIPTNIKGASNISGTSVETNLLIDNMIYDIVVTNGIVTLSNPRNLDIPSGYYRIYGPTKDVYADINPSTNDAIINLPNGKTNKQNVSDISFVYDKDNIGTLVVEKDDKNFVKGKYLLGDHLLIGKRKVRTKDIKDPSDISIKLM